MSMFKRQMTSYGSYHTNKTNKILHVIGTPFIIFSILGASSHLTLTAFGSDVGMHWIIAVGLTLWYVYFHLLYGGLAGLWILGLATLVPQLWELSDATRWMTLACMQIGGWATLFAGHYIEGRKPALFDNLAQIFNAAPFVTAELIELITGKHP